MDSIPDKLMGRRRKPSKRRGVPKEARSFSRQELINIMRDNNLRASDEVTKKRAEGNLELPSVAQFVKEFKSWSNAVAEAFGYKPKIETTFEEDLVTIIKAIGFYKIKSKNHYLEMRKRFPESFPPLHIIYEKKLTWEEIYNCGRSYDTSLVLHDYVRLYLKQNKYPTRKECEAVGIDYSKLLNYFETRDNLKRNTDKMVKWIEESKK